MRNYKPFLSMVEQFNRYSLTCPAGDPRAPRGPLVVLPAVPAQFFSLAHLLSIAPRRRLAERRAWNKLLIVFRFVLAPFAPIA